MPKPKKNPVRNLLPILHIYCEGEKTEPNYLRSYINKYHPIKTRRVKIKKTKKNTPDKLINEAIGEKSSKDNPENDLFWVVYDREEEIEGSVARHKKSWDKAEENKIKIALFNTCLEFGVLCHF